MRKALLFTGVMLALIACSALSAPIAFLEGTPTPSPTETLEPTLTPSPSRTAEPTETPTETPSATPEPTLSPTPVIVIIATLAAPTASSGLSCKLNWQSPKNNVTFHPEDRFSAGWKVTNTGTVPWTPETVDFLYLGGAKMYVENPLVKVESSVSPGEAIILTVGMEAPLKEIRYTTYWGLRKGDVYFCRLALSIFVEKP